MRLFHQIGLGLIAAAVVPLSTAGFGVVAWNERALEREVKARFDQTARHAALAIASDVEGRARLLTQVASMIAWDKLTDEERRGALALLRGQARATGTRLYLDNGPPIEELEPGVDGSKLFQNVPLDRARKEGLSAMVFAPATRREGKAEIVAALQIAGGVLAFHQDLGLQRQRLAEVRAGDSELSLFLVDDEGTMLLSDGRETQPGPEAQAAIKRRVDGRTRRMRDGDRVVLAGFQPVGGLSWSVLVEEDASLAFAEPRRMRLVTLSATCGAILLAVGLAFLLARRLTSALERLAAAARKVGGGELDAQVDVHGSVEVRSLGENFNSMTAELRRSRDEIAAWNRELEARVEERTRQLKDAQAQLVQAQKLAALGQLGAGVAHEINNPLAGVLGHVQLLLQTHPKGDADHEDLRMIDEAARKASEVVHNLLRFSVQRQSPVPMMVDLNKLVQETLSLTRTLLDEQKITLELAIDKDRPRARADGGQLAQVILNLVSNARTAMPKGGRLTVSTGRKDQEAFVAVADTGRGIAPEIRDRIFEPFFTTKDEWSNVGLGLSVSFRLVEEAGGRIVVESEVGVGSTFTVYLPV